ncbi:MAG: hypothetical protein E7277_05985 [Lachnospiraceae bacterium]|nr:hypothetical protein [Lachnospiraceae bacterium]
MAGLEDKRNLVIRRIIPMIMAGVLCVMRVFTFYAGLDEEISGMVIFEHYGHVVLWLPFAVFLLATVIGKNSLFVLPLQLGAIATILFFDWQYWQYSELSVTGSFWAAKLLDLILILYCVGVALKYRRKWEYKTIRN